MSRSKFFASLAVSKLARPCTVSHSLKYLFRIWDLHRICQPECEDETIPME